MGGIVAEERWLPVPGGTVFANIFAKQWLPPEPEAGAPLVLLHDSLGCVALWRDFPERLVRATGRRVIAYDRLGFGASSPHPGQQDVAFVTAEAQLGFAAVAEAFALKQCVLFGHSVGGAMAAACAAQWPALCVGVITESAQAFVEQCTRDGICATRDAFAEPGQMQRLERYHGDKAGWVLAAWVDTWLSEAFRHWSLAEVLPHVRCPALVLHGEHDEYGSRAQPLRYAQGIAGDTTLVLLEDCGHVPHREKPAEVLEAVSAFLRTLG